MFKVVSWFNLRSEIFCNRNNEKICNVPRINSSRKDAVTLKFSALSLATGKIMFRREYLYFSTWFPEQVQYHPSEQKMIQYSAEME